MGTTMKELAASLAETNNKVDQLADLMLQQANAPALKTLPNHVPAVLPAPVEEETPLETSLPAWIVTFKDIDGETYVQKVQNAKDYTEATTFFREEKPDAEILGVAKDIIVDGPARTMEEYFDVTDPDRRTATLPAQPAPETGGIPKEDSPRYTGSPRLSIDTTKRKETFKIKEGDNTVDKIKNVYMRRENRDLVYVTAMKTMPKLRLAIVDADDDPILMDIGGKLAPQIIELECRRTSWGNGQGNVLFGGSDNTPLIEIGDGRVYKLAGGIWLTVAERLS